MAKTPLTAWQKAVANPPYKNDQALQRGHSRRRGITRSTIADMREPEALIVEMRLMDFEIGQRVRVNQTGPPDWVGHYGTIKTISRSYDWIVEMDRFYPVSFRESELDLA